MSNNIEIEGKILVTETEFESLLKYFKRTDEDKIVQINHYIDSQDQQLRKLGFALRIREKINRYVLTLKTPLSEGLLEKDQDISKEVYKSFKYENKFPDGSIKNFLLMLGLNVDSLSIVTSLKTERYDIDYNGTGINSQPALSGWQKRNLILWYKNKQLVTGCAAAGKKRFRGERSEQDDNAKKTGPW